MDIAQRIKSLEMVPARALHRHVSNWRKHPAEQRAALQAVLAEVGWVDAVIARRDENGQLQLIDGHLRADIADDAEVPVLVTDLSEGEAELILATHDPLTSMAQADARVLNILLQESMGRSEQLDDLLVSIADNSGLTEIVLEPQPTNAAYSPEAANIPGAYPLDELRTFTIYLQEEEMDQFLGEIKLLQGEWGLSATQDALRRAVKEAADAAAD